MRTLNKGQSLTINLLRTMKNFGIINFEKIVLTYKIKANMQQQSVNIKVIWE
ncbi:hypothetical protein UFOVP53_124 [uncultured Caudovirales phage]|uniref:Uncharacterized protein n=1 Tax=uncultured Caudovirales phage TaxID=2100421 RepID=A0A6J5KWV5_9CAUD|nr:hypothetical protein UFOVP53_124 [uncultured Caudovirales phage]